MAIRIYLYIWAAAVFISLTAVSGTYAGVLDVCGETFFDEVVGYGKPVLVEFYRPNCPVCKRMMPIYEDLSAELSGKVKAVRINTMEDTALSMQFDIKNVPTFLYFDGGNVMDRHVGGNSKEGLTALAKMPVARAAAPKASAAQDTPVPSRPAPAQPKAAAAPSAPRADVPEVCDETFFAEVVGYGRPVVVEFFSPTCPVCKKMTPVVEELSAELSGKVKVVRVNTRDNARLSMQFEIANVPTFIYFDGGNAMMKHIGGSSRDGLKQRLGIR